jgi:hypothetical protein
MIVNMEEVKIKMICKKNIFVILIAFTLLFGASYIFAEQSDATSWVRIYISYPEEANYILSEGFDVCSGSAGEYVDVIVNQDELKRIADRGYAYEVLLDDIDKLGGPSNLGYSNYHNYTELTNDLQTLAQTYPDIAKLYSLGQGWAQLGNIWALRVTNGSSDNSNGSNNGNHEEDGSNDNQNKPRLLLVGVHHAREPMTCEIVYNDAKQLCSLYQTDSLVKKAVDNFEIWIVPVINVDGWINDDVENSRKMWRKNGRDNNNDGKRFTSADGVDVNRNYSYKWGYDNQGSSPNPSNESYRGPSAFSEPEPCFIRDLITSLGNFKVGVSYHSYGEYIIMPWGYINAYPEGEDYNTYWTIINGMNDTIQSYYGRKYTAGNCYVTVGYPTNGDFDDWAYGEKDAKNSLFGMTFEVNSQSQGGFYPSDTYIPQTTETHWLALKWLLQWMINKYVTDISVLYFEGISTDGGVKLTWDASSDNEKIVGFDVYRREVLDSPTGSQLTEISNYVKINDKLITGGRPYHFTDSTTSLNMHYEYRLDVITNDNDYNGGYTKVNTSSQVPISLEKVYPNPVSDNLHIGLIVSEPTNININVYDISGRRIDSVTSANLVEGHNVIDIDTGKLSNGVYSFVITSDKANLSSRFCVLK